jgi:hypothetical protein
MSPGSGYIAPNTSPVVLFIDIVVGNYVGKTEQAYSGAIMIEMTQNRCIVRLS